MTKLVSLLRSRMSTPN